MKMLSIRQHKPKFKDFRTCSEFKGEISNAIYIKRADLSYITEFK